MYNIYAYLELVREYCTIRKPFCVNGVGLLMYRISSDAETSTIPCNNGLDNELNIATFSHRQSIGDHKITVQWKVKLCFFTLQTVWWGETLSFQIQAFQHPNKCLDLHQVQSCDNGSKIFNILLMNTSASSFHQLIMRMMVNKLLIIEIFPPNIVLS